MLDWLHEILALNVDLIAAGGYPAIFLLMAIESSFIPFPSEVVVPPAGFLAAKGEMSFAWVMAASIGGSLVGAWFNYWFAIRVGRPFFHRWGKWFLVSRASLDKSEAFFVNHGEIGTFVGRLVPAVRQLISIPAGMARMSLLRFTLFTSLGAGLWCAVLFGVGYSVGKAGGRLDLAGIKERSTGVFLQWVLPALVILVGAYVLWHRSRKARREPPSPGSGDGAQSPP